MSEYLTKLMFVFSLLSVNAACVCDNHTSSSSGISISLIGLYNTGIITYIDAKPNGNKVSIKSKSAAKVNLLSNDTQCTFIIHTTRMKGEIVLSYKSQLFSHEDSPSWCKSISDGLEYKYTDLMIVKHDFPYAEIVLVESNQKGDPRYQLNIRDFN
jgi:hypothetical protein